MGMFLNMNMQRKMSLRLEQLCSLCGGDLKHRDDHGKQVMILGGVNYGVCPICFNEADPDDPKWRKKVDVWREKRRKAGMA